MGNTRKKRERSRRYIWSNNDWEFFKINARHQTTDQDVSENTSRIKKIKKLKNLCVGKSFKLQKDKDKEKILEAREKNIISIKETGWELYWSSFQKRCKHKESRLKYVKYWYEKHQFTAMYLVELYFKYEIAIKAFSNK